ncbi:MAG: hypothetical protein WBA74_09605, partial [Cyclobacteriaceae bacterium]
MSKLTDLSAETLQAISKELAWQYRIIPKVNSDPLELYCNNSVDSQLLSDELEILLGKEVKLIGVEEQEIEYGLSRYYRKGSPQAESKAEKFDASSNNFVESLIKEAKSLDCSD